MVLVNRMAKAVIGGNKEAAWSVIEDCRGLPAEDIVDVAFWLPQGAGLEHLEAFLLLFEGTAPLYLTYIIENYRAQGRLDDEKFAEVIREGLAAGADANISIREPLLADMVRHGYPECARVLAPVSRLSWQEETAVKSVLGIAITYNRADMIDFLAEAMKDEARWPYGLSIVQTRGTEYYSPIHLWLYYESTPDCLERLIRAGIDVDATDSEGLTALARSVAYTNPNPDIKREQFYTLLRYGADPNHGPLRTRALAMALASSDFNLSVMYMLLEAGANAHGLAEYTTCTTGLPDGTTRTTHNLCIHSLDRRCLQIHSEELINAHLGRYVLRPGAAGFYQYMKARGARHFRCPMYVVRAIVSMAQGVQLKRTQFPE